MDRGQLMLGTRSVGNNRNGGQDSRKIGLPRMQVGRFGQNEHSRGSRRGCETGGNSSKMETIADWTWHRLNIMRRRRPEQARETVDARLAFRRGERELLMRG